MSRRLLLLCYFYPPLAGGGVHRVLGFTRWLPEYGWDCTVVCAGREDYWMRDENLESRIPPATEVIRLPGGSVLAAWLGLGRSVARAVRGSHDSPAGRRSGFVSSGLRSHSDWLLVRDSCAGWVRRAGRAAAARIARGDVSAVLSSSPPDSVHLVALALARRSALPWVADFRDAWVGLHHRRPRTAWNAARHRALERRVLAGADLVLAASRTHADDLERSREAQPRRVVHLPDGYEPDVKAPGAGPEPETPVPGHEHFTLVFTGTLALMPDAEVFLEALHEVLARRPEARRRIRARLAGPFEASYQDRAEALGLRGIVEFCGPLAHRQARALQRAADVLLLWKRGGCRGMVPGKVYEYLDAGRPILALLEDGDEAARLVRRAGAACVPPGDRGALAAEIERGYLAWKERRQTGGDPRVEAIRPAWLEEHTRASLAAQLASLLDGLASGRRTP